MKTFMKSVLMVSLLLTTSAASAQRIVQDIEDWMSSNISRVLDAKIDVQKSLGQERDVQQTGAPLKWRFDTYSFTLPKKQRKLLDEMIQAFEANGHDNPNCYSINSQTETANGDINSRKGNLMIGEDVNRYVTIGKDYNNYLNVNILDAADTTKTHRYAYALEWREARKGAVDVRYIVTYAKIPSAKSSISVLDLGKAHVNPFDNITIKGPVRFQWQGEGYPIEMMDSVLRDAGERSKQKWERMDSILRNEGKRRDRMDSIFRKGKEKADRIRKAFVGGNSIVVWNDSLNHDTDPVTDVVLRLQQGRSITSDDLLCNDNVLLVFSQMKQQFNEGENLELNAISIYSLCKRARETGYFTHDGEAKELLKSEIQDMVDGLVRLDGFKTERGYLELAIKELDKIESKPWK